MQSVNLQLGSLRRSQKIVGNHSRNLGEEKVEPSEMHMKPSKRRKDEKTKVIDMPLVEIWPAGVSDPVESFAVGSTKI